MSTVESALVFSLAIWYARVYMFLPLLLFLLLLLPFLLPSTPFPPPSLPPPLLLLLLPWQKPVWCLCFFGKNLLVSGSGDSSLKVIINKGEMVSGKKGEGGKKREEEGNGES